MQVQMTTNAAVGCCGMVKTYSVTVRKKGRTWTYNDPVTGSEYRDQFLLAILGDVKMDRYNLFKSYVDEMAGLLKGDPVLPDRLGESMQVTAGGCIRLVITPVRDTDSTVYCCIPQRMPLWLCAPFLTADVHDIPDKLAMRIRGGPLAPELEQAFKEFNGQ